MRRLAAVLAVLAFSSTSALAARHRAVHIPAAIVDDGTPSAWLAAHASTIHSTDLSSDRTDLAAFGALVGGAHVVGLGDGTHGTHEFYTIKLRFVDYLVRELGFDVISFEGSYALFDEIDTYAQGGSGDPRALLGAAGELGYHFWDTEEILAVVEWMRDYNLHRGDRPAVHIAGADVWDPRGSAEDVVAYLDRVDPSAASTIRQDYQCVLALTGLFPLGCNQGPADSAYATLAARQPTLGTGNGAADFDEALHNARVVVQSFTFGTRDRNMAENVRWLREHRSQSSRVVYWAHSEHAGKLASEQAVGGSTGMFLMQDLGSDYVAVGTLTGAGQYITWTGNGPEAFDVPVPESGTYEAYFQLGARPAILIPMRGDVPQWLSTPARYFFAGTAPAETYLTASLPAKFDGVIYIHATTPIHVLSH